MVMVISLLLLGGGPAAASDELGLSRDGTTWAPDLSDPLFEAAVRWVPGDSRTASFYVRNQSGQAGTLSLDILGTATDSLMQTGDLSVEAHGAGGDWTPVTEPGTHRLLSAGQVPSSATRRVDVTVTFDPASSNQSQVRSLDLALQVRLIQDVEDNTPGDDASDDGLGLLPDTGGPSPWTVAIAAGLVLVGTLTARRRGAGEA